MVSRVPRSFDILVGGGGIMGSSVSFFLKKMNPSLRIAVVERDSAYKVASTSLSVGGFRQQFSVEENIRMSCFSNNFLHNIGESLGLPDSECDVQYFQEGYLVLASSEEGKDVLTENFALQKTFGCDLIMESGKDLGTRYPWLNTEDIIAGTLGLRNEGWLDPYALLQLFRKAAKKLGVEYIESAIETIDNSENKVNTVNTTHGTIDCGTFVNCCGSWSNNVNKMFSNIDMMVAPRKRDVYVFKATQEDADFINSCEYNNIPLVSDTSGIWFRRDGPKGSRTFLLGTCPIGEDEDIDPCLSVPQCQDVCSTDVSALWETELWPLLAHRVPRFENIKLINSWSGFYDYNKLDQNAIVGKHPEFDNVFVATGFSGHGLQQGPAIGMALSELITHEEYRTIDLSRLGLERIVKKEPLKEKNII